MNIYARDLYEPYRLPNIPLSHPCYLPLNNSNMTEARND
jgi:hypothetical protein